MYYSSFYKYNVRIFIEDALLNTSLYNGLRISCTHSNVELAGSKQKNLMRLGVDSDDAYVWSRTRVGGWRVAQSPILKTTITLTRLKKGGYIAMLELYH